MLWRELDERVYVELLQLWRTIVTAHWNKYAYSWVPGTNNHQGKFINSRTLFFTRSLKSRALPELVYSAEWECILDISPGPGAAQQPSVRHSLVCRGVTPVCLCCHCIPTFYLCAHNSSFNGITTVGPMDHLVQYGLNNSTCKDAVSMWGHVWGAGAYGFRRTLHLLQWASLFIPQASKQVKGKGREERSFIPPRDHLESKSITARVCRLLQIVF